MLKISRLADYSSSVMRYLACFAEFTDQSKSAVEVSEATHITLPTVRKILKLLQTAGLLISVRGKEGGYRLAKHSSQINLAQIVEAIEGPIALTECTREIGNQCSHTQVCTMRKDWQLINKLIKDALSAQTLEKLCQGEI